MNTVVIVADLKKKAAKYIIDQILNLTLLIIFKRKTLLILGSE